MSQRKEAETKNPSKTIEESFHRVGSPSPSMINAESRKIRPLNSWALCFAFGLAYYVSQPPLAQPWAAFCAMGIFSWMASGRYSLSSRDYFRLWVASAAMWLALLQGIRLAFWPLYAGWVALSLYLAIYVPISLGIARSLQLRFRFPSFLACPIAWLTCEVLRSYFLTGFAGCLVAHSQTPWPYMIQLASQFGGYSVGFLVVMISSTVADWSAYIFGRTKLSFPSALIRIVSTALCAMCLAYSSMTLMMRDQFLREQSPIKPLGRILLIQDHMPTMFDATPELIQEGWREYERTTRQAAKQVEETGPIDVLVWPESVFSGGAPYVKWDRGKTIPDWMELDFEGLKALNHTLELDHQAKVDILARPFAKARPNMLLGTDVWDIHDGICDRYNAALWVDGNSSQVSYYAKNHLVMFGEYIPLLSNFPSLMKAVGLGTLSTGSQPAVFSLSNGARLSPSVCFEDVVPHLIQRHVAKLSKENKSPDMLINISNDGWFRGSSILDHQLNCAILLAVENRRPVLIAANTGLTAWIDGDGRIVKTLPRMESGWILAEPIPDGRTGLWQLIGDLPAKTLCLIGALPIFGWLISKWPLRRSSRAAANRE